MCSTAGRTVSRSTSLWHERDGLLVSDEGPLDLWPGMHERTPFSPALVAELGEVRLDGRVLPAPADPERLLAEHRYGADWRTPTRPIVSVATHQVVPAAEMTDDARGLLPRLAERDAVLRGLIWQGRSGRFWSSRGGRWLLRSGLPLDPPPGGSALEHAQHSLAWTEQAIAELEHPTPALAARRWSRRAVRLARRLG